MFKQDDVIVPEEVDPILYRRVVIPLTSSNTGGAVSNGPDIIFERLGNMVTVHIAGDITRVSNSSSVNMPAPFIPVGFRPIASTSIIYDFNYNAARDYMLFIYTNGRMIVYARNVATGGSLSTTSFKATSHTYLTNDE